MNDALHFISVLSSIYPAFQTIIKMTVGFIYCSLYVAFEQCTWTSNNLQFGFQAGLGTRMSDNLHMLLVGKYYIMLVLKRFELENQIRSPWSKDIH